MFMWILIRYEPHIVVLHYAPLAADYLAGEDAFVRIYPVFVFVCA